MVKTEALFTPTQQGQEAQRIRCPTFFLDLNTLHLKELLEPSLAM